jgi:repressor LexA
LVAVPILGQVPAGTPLLAAENVVGELLVDARTARGRCFALEVQGDSMIDADIQDGDYVIVRQQQLAESGEIVVAMLKDEATVKRLRLTAEAIELRPENRRFSPIPIGPDDDLRILGKVVAIHRRDRDGSPSQ